MIIVLIGHSSHLSGEGCGLAFSLGKMLRKTASRFVFKSGQWLAEGVCQIKTLVGVLGSEDETVESAKILYLLSIVFLVSLAFLSPDKMSQLFAPSQPGFGIIEKVQDTAKVIRKLIQI